MDHQASFLFPTHRVNARLRWGATCALIFFSSLAVARDQAKERPNVEQCATQLGLAGQFTVRIIAAPAPSWKVGPPLVLGGPQQSRRARDPSIEVIGGKPPTSQVTEASVSCWRDALGLPDPKDLSSSITFSLGVSSEAPGLDASARDEKLATSKTRPQVGLDQEVQKAREDYYSCSGAYPFSTVEAASLSLEFDGGPGKPRLQGWSVAAPAPEIAERQSAQFFARCLTRVVGASMYLGPMRISDQTISFRSGQ